MLTAEDLIAFEKDIAAEFEAGQIKAPVHLAGGNEQELIDIFKGIRPNDWILCSWRSHYHALLKGVPRDQLKRAIMEGRSIALCFPEYKMLSSAIVGGICPIATGLGWAIKERGSDDTVHCFIGDMTATTGIYAECVRYCRRHELPVKFYCEDNRMSVSTNTQESWGLKGDRHQSKFEEINYRYDLTWPHVGIGKFVRF